MPDLDPALIKLADGYINWWDARQKKREVRERPKGPLFHYTDGAGLKGIVADEKLRLTDISHLNDHRELNHGFDLALERLWYHARSGGPIRDFCDVISAAVQRRFSDRFGIFVASLSAAKDDLGQWRAYAMNGHGYSIGFSSRLFRISETRPTNDNEVYWIGKVVYDEGDARRNQHLAVDRAVRIVSHAFANRLVPNRLTRSLLEAMSVNMSVPILWNALTTKHVAYEAERETRLIMVNSIHRLAPFIETHVRNGEVVPFVALSLPMRRRGSLTNLIVGPASSSDSVNGARQFLRSVGLDTSVRLERSSIPYRTP